MGFLVLTILLIFAIQGQSRRELNEGKRELNEGRRELNDYYKEGSCHIWCDDHWCDPELYCGQKSGSDDCWCDEECYKYEDCCEDVAGVCDYLPPTGDFEGCDYSCGKKSKFDECFCDKLCRQMDDCCDNYWDVCATYMNLNDFRRELNEGERKLNEGKRELKEVRRELNEGKRELNKGRRELNDYYKKGSCYIDCDETVGGVDPDFYCGKKSEDGCWCDEDCYKWEDCCEDVADICDYHPPTGSGCDYSCGEKSSFDDCWCDDICQTFDDCCDNYEDVCSSRRALEDSPTKRLPRLLKQFGL